MEMEEVTITIACPVGDGHNLAQSLMSSVPADVTTVYSWSHGVRPLSEQAVKEIVKVAPTEVLGRLIFIVHEKIYELEEADIDGVSFGYDIYKEDDIDPINLGHVAYFDTEPTQEDVKKWIEDFVPVV